MNPAMALFRPRSFIICRQCRQLSISTVRPSGHNRWSKIKHDKLKKDLQKNKSLSILAKELMHASRVSGPDPTDNPRLAAAITAAKQAGFPKTSIESAIARGQGVSTTGKALEPLVIEALLSSSVAVVIDCLTDSKARTLQDVRTIIKDHEGVPSTIGYMFTKRGRIIFDPGEQDLTADDVLDEALEAGAEEIEDDENGSIMVLTEPSKTASVESTLQAKFQLKVRETGIVWVPSQDMLVQALSEGTVNKLCAFIDELRRESSVQNISMNVAQGSLKEDVWTQLQSRLDM
ncbi:MAG: hypothetical protein M1823_002705 [Watsoniomyces obsoletus]|nr:MAG: hypothetical protein M1823_002705 [Watsoniomyces obsoletus]